MSTQRLYDQWSATYDTVDNKTRDLEKLACENVLKVVSFTRVFELGSGTGKNTPWLAKHAELVLSVDFSEEMQAIARSKVTNSNVVFRLGDVRTEWSFIDSHVDLITCSLILEHVEDLGFIFHEAAKALSTGGHFYICELHPFKQYEGSKARFETEEGVQVTECFRHHVTDYTNAALNNGFEIERMDEWFDDDDHLGTPRLISFLFSKRL
ncbi:MAG TPA: class I SAM-dependent methyltransferase [Pyrinomonadaceae bacterium]|nr:class I SAM-dependent methyltransferase [Pyrinomonadaceae bacterium]